MLDRSKIGFDRTIASEWVDVALARVIAGDAPEAARRFLWDFLEGIEAGTTNNSGRGKTLTVLTRLWVSEPAHATPLKRAALDVVVSVSGNERIGIHWAMACATHPFFFDVATHVGKLIKLHGHANRSQIKRRMTDDWGDRSTLERTIQHVLKSMTQWGLLRAGKEHGSLIAQSQRTSIEKNVGLLLLQAVLLSHGKGLPVTSLIDHPALFPFAIHLSGQNLAGDNRFRVQRQGDQSDFVELARSG